MKGTFRKRGCKCTGKRCTCDATWSFRIDIGVDPQTGKRKQKEFYGYATKREAETACAIKIAEVESGVYVPDKKIPFKDYVDDWLESYTRVKKGSTVRTRKYGVSVLLSYFSFEQMSSITRKAYEKALGDMLDEGYSENTITIVHSTARMIFKSAMKDEIIAKNPLQYAVVPKRQITVEELEKEEQVAKYLEKEELQKFLTSARKRGLENDYLVFLTLAYSGLRIGELCALKFKDIDFEEKTISITKTLYCETNKVGEYELLPPKTRKSKRVIDVDDIVIQELKKQHTKVNELRMKKRDNYHDKDFVITNKRKPGYPEPLHTFNNRMNRLLRIANLNTELTPHSFRHTHTSLMAEAGATLPEIMDRLGHKDDKVTKWVYLHVTKAVKKKTSQKFSELMRSLS